MPEVAKADKGDATAEKPRFDFYKILPGVEEPKVQAYALMTTAPRAMKMPRRTMAMTMPIISADCWAPLPRHPEAAHDEQEDEEIVDRQRVLGVRVEENALTNCPPHSHQTKSPNRTAAVT